MSEETISANTPVILEADEYSRYMLRTPAEVLMVLRSLGERVAQITVFFNEGQDMLLTTIAAVASDHLVLDFGPDGEMNRKALMAEKHFCVAMLDKVRIQFILRGFREIEHEGRRAFLCALPDELLRLQRREYYRLLTPIVRPLVCSVPIPLSDGNIHLHEAHIFDISGGGMGIAAPAEGIPFDLDMRFPNCRVELPEVGIVSGTLRVRSLFDVSLRSGAKMRRAGCEFVNLPGPMMTLIQRYIIKVERERKARESGMV
jgi:c-di-GMP-binding flagellar brake protein YcgR